jgi:hypothetical protein
VQDILLTKGAKHAMKRLEDVQRRHWEEDLARKVAEEVAEVKRERAKQLEVDAEAAAARKKGVWNSLTGILFGKIAPAAAVPPRPSVHDIEAYEAVEAQDRVAQQVQLEQVQREKREQALAENRQAAIEKATLGGAVLAAAVVLRKIVFKV